MLKMGIYIQMVDGFQAFLGRCYLLKDVFGQNNFGWPNYLWGFGHSPWKIPPSIDYGPGKIKIGFVRFWVGSNQ